MSAPADRALGRIVIVDDDPFLVEQLTWALKGRFVVSAARDATLGRALCESESDLYLFDLRLPPSNEVQEGLDLLRHVRRRDPEATVVMMSGEGERAHALGHATLGAQAVTAFRTHVASELDAITQLGGKALADLGDHLNLFCSRSYSLSVEGFLLISPESLRSLLEPAKLVAEGSVTCA